MRGILPAAVIHMLLQTALKTPVTITLNKEYGTHSWIFVRFKKTRSSWFEESGISELGNFLKAKNLFASAATDGKRRFSGDAAGLCGADDAATRSV